MISSTQRCAVVAVTHLFTHGVQHSYFGNTENTGNNDDGRNRQKSYQQFRFKFHSSQFSVIRSLSFVVGDLSPTRLVAKATTTNELSG